MTTVRPIFVTGSAGFIGSNFVRMWLRATDIPVVSIDALTYAGSRASLFEAGDHPRHAFLVGDIRDVDQGFLSRCRPQAIVHFAAESHVDYSIEHPEPFVSTNVIGTFRLLDAALAYWRSLEGVEREAFRFLHVSTDEVFGSLNRDEAPCREGRAYRPSSPYSASKAASDHLVRAWGHTYGLPVIVTNCTNNYGPAQHPEKLIPLMILNGIEDRPLTIHGDGSFVRDWIHVEDHCRALRAVLTRGRVGEQYLIGAKEERSNLAVVRHLCDILDDRRPGATSHHDRIVFVEDRLGQDRRYAIDPAKVGRETGWVPTVDFDAGLQSTVDWYLDNAAWVEEIRRREGKAVA